VRIAVTLVLALVLAPAAAAGPVRPGDWPLIHRAPTRQEQLLAGLAGRLAQRTVSLRCGATRSTEALGVVPFFNGHPADYTILSSEACADLAVFAATPRTFDPAACPSLHNQCSARLFEMTQALETVAHEAYHLFGQTNEATTDCWGMQSLWYVAQQLGASAAQAQALGGWYWQTVYPQRAHDVPQYFSKDCHSGGRLDLRPSDSRWPG
jgi:hypothetical protein